jgi:uncharacterized protein (DUF488 family)
MPKLYTIGHSTHTLEKLLAMLQAHHITYVVDIRFLPRSRRMPWFNEKSLQASLKNVNIGYLSLRELGGMRRAHKDSINQGWRKERFRGYADYMQTPEFFAALKKLNQLINKKGKEQRVAIMCAEALPWRCHRSLVADAETIRGVPVLHIMSPTNLHEHELTEFAVVDKSTRPMTLYYPKKGRE